MLLAQRKSARLLDLARSRENAINVQEEPIDDPNEPTTSTKRARNEVRTPEVANRATKIAQSQCKLAQKDGSKEQMLEEAKKYYIDILNQETTANYSRIQRTVKLLAQLLDDEKYQASMSDAEKFVVGIDAMTTKEAELSLQAVFFWRKNELIFMERILADPRLKIRAVPLLYELYKNAFASWATKIGISPNIEDRGEAGLIEDRKVELLMQILEKEVGRELANKIDKREKDRWAGYVKIVLLNRHTIHNQYRQLLNKKTGCTRQSKLEAIVRLIGPKLRNVDATVKSQLMKLFEEDCTQDDVTAADDLISHNQPPSIKKLVIVFQIMFAYKKNNLEEMEWLVFARNITYPPKTQEQLQGLYAICRDEYVKNLLDEEYERTILVPSYELNWEELCKKSGKEKKHIIEYFGRRDRHESGLSGEEKREMRIKREDLIAKYGKWHGNHMASEILKQRINGKADNEKEEVRRGKKRARRSATTVRQPTKRPRRGATNPVTNELVQEVLKEEEALENAAGTNRNSGSTSSPSPIQEEDHEIDQINDGPMEIEGDASANKIPTGNHHGSTLPPPAIEDARGDGQVDGVPLENKEGAAPSNEISTESHTVSNQSPPAIEEENDNGHVSEVPMEAEAEASTEGIPTENRDSSTPAPIEEIGNGQMLQMPMEAGGDPLAYFDNNDLIDFFPANMEGPYEQFQEVPIRIEEVAPTNDIPACYFPPASLVPTAPENQNGHGIVDEVAPNIEPAYGEAPAVNEPAPFVAEASFQERVKVEVEEEEPIANVAGQGLPQDENVKREIKEEVVEQPEEHVNVQAPRIAPQPVLQNINWAPPPGCCLNYNEWTVEQMGDWVFQVTGCETTQRFFQTEYCAGNFMDAILEPEYQRDFRISDLLLRRLANAAETIMDAFRRSG